MNLIFCLEKVVIKIMEKVLINKKNIWQVLIKSNIQNVLTNLVITNWGKGVLQIGAAFLLQIGAAFLLQIRARFITNKGRYYKLGQSLLQIGAGITNWSKVYYKLGQILQIGANYYKLGRTTRWNKNTYQMTYRYFISISYLSLYINLISFSYFFHSGRSKGVRKTLLLKEGMSSNDL